MAVHIFKRSDPETHRWTNVYASDLVCADGTIGWKVNDFPVRHVNGTKHLEFGGKKLMFVLSRHPGVPGELNIEDDDRVTFVVLTRHGVVIIIKNQG